MYYVSKGEMIRILEEEWTEETSDPCDAIELSDEFRSGGFVKEDKTIGRSFW